MSRIVMPRGGSLLEILIHVYFNFRTHDAQNALLMIRHLSRYGAKINDIQMLSCDATLRSKHTMYIRKNWSLVAEGSPHYFV